jgi:cell division inhibitor SepF
VPIYSGSGPQSLRQSEVYSLRKWENEEEVKYSHNSNRGLFEKFLNMFGFEAEEVGEDEEAYAHEEFSRKELKGGGKLLSIPNSNKPVKMIIIEPESFEEVQTIVDHLKNKRAVILNLEETEKVVARRIADFIGGAVYALDGVMQKVSGSIFLFTPAHIEVTVPLRAELKDKERERDRVSIPPNLTSTLFRNDRER